MIFIVKLGNLTQKFAYWCHLRSNLSQSRSGNRFQRWCWDPLSSTEKLNLSNEINPHSCIFSENCKLTIHYSFILTHFLKIIIRGVSLFQSFDLIFEKFKVNLEVLLKYAFLSFKLKRLILTLKLFFLSLWLIFVESRAEMMIVTN